MIIFLREKFIAQLFMWVIAIVFLVGTVFLYSNTQGGGENPESEVVLRINETEISREQFETAVANAIDNQKRRQNFGTPDRKATEKNVIDYLINQSIFGSVNVGDPEVTHYIRSDANRVSQYNLYQQNGVADLYTQNVRYQLSAQSIQNSIHALELVTDTEVEQAYRLEADKAKIAYLEFKHSDYAPTIAVDDAAAAAYFEENREDYQVGEQINVKFIKIDPANHVSEEEVKRYYEQNPTEFMTVDAVKARHILKKFPDNPTDLDREKTKIAAEELHATLTAAIAAGTDFAELAKTHSEGPSGAQGGALRGGNPKLPSGDYFARGDMVPPFEKAAFDTLQPGEISEPVETRFGYHIIKLEERRAPEPIPFEQVQSEVQQRLIQSNGVDKAKDVATDLLYEIEIQDYDAALALDRYKDLALTALETDFFTRDATNIPHIGARWGYQSLIEELFGMEVNVRKVVEVKRSNTEQVDSYFVATVLAKKPAAVPPFEEVKAQVIDDLKTERAKDAAFADAEKLFNKRGDATSLTGVLEKYETPDGLTAGRLSVQESVQFVLNASNNYYVPGLGTSAETMFAAFRMDVDAIGGPFRGDNAAYIIQLIEREEPDLETFQTDPAEKARHRQAIIQAKKREALFNWVAARKKASELWIHPDYQ